MSFTPETAESIARARQHSVGDLLRRTALRYPDKLAVVAGDRRVTYAEFDAAVNRCAPRARRRGVWRKGDRLALLCHNCWQFAVLAFATARLGVVLVPVNFMLGAERDRVHPRATPAPPGWSPRTRSRRPRRRRSPSAGRAAAASAAGSAVGPAARLGGRRQLDRQRRRQPRPRSPVADDDPLRLMYTSGTESRPKGVLLSSRSLIASTSSCAIDGGMSADDIEVHSLPMYHCAQLDCFFSVDVYLGATSVILPGPDPAALLADDRARAGDQAVLPADGVDLAAAPPRLRHHRPVEPAQGLLRRLADAGRGAARAAAPAARRAAVELLRPDRDGAAGHDPAPGRAAAARRLARAGAALNVETRWSTTTATTGAARRGRRDRAPQPARHAGLLPRRGEDRRGVPRRLVPLRRPRRARRRRLPVRRRPQEGHDQDRRRERRQPRGRGGASTSSTASPRSRCSGSATRTGSRR